MTIKKITLALGATLALCSSVAHAQWSVSGGYTNVSSDDDAIDISVGAITAGLGYSFTSESGDWSIMPEFRAGVGVGDDTVRLSGIDVDIELSRYLSANIRGSYHLNDIVTLYVQPAYTNLEFEVSAFGSDASEDEWEFGAGAGINAKLTESISWEIHYERFSDADVISTNVRFAF